MCIQKQEYLTDTMVKVFSLLAVFPVSNIIKREPAGSLFLSKGGEI